MNADKGIRQIFLDASVIAESPVSHQIAHATRVQCREKYQANLEESTRSACCSLVSSYNFSPHPLLLSQIQIFELERFNHALSIAITNIVERWWTDREAALPLRMPLGPSEEALLQWMQKATEDKLVPPFNIRKGVWRPDFLLEESRFRICEINARFPFELFPLAIYGHQALGNSAQGSGFIPATDQNKMIHDILAMFNPNLPIHLLKGSESSVSLDLFILLVKQQTGIKPRVMTFSDLRLVEDKDSRTGSALCCLYNALSEATTGKRATLEKVHQIVLQCTQAELLALPQDILRHLALHSVNDLRSIFFAHDKRLLGIVLQELNDLVSKHRVLTSEQAQILQQGIAPTIIPGSPELKHLILMELQSKNIKDEFILKPARLGDSEGIIFGRDMTTKQWESAVKSMTNPRQEQTQYIVQRLIKQPVFELLVNNEEGIQKAHLVGTYHVIDGNFSGLGVWRTGSGRISSSEGSWLVSALPLLN